MFAQSAAGSDKPPPPQLPLAQWWSTDLKAPVSAGPVSDGSRIYVALKTAELVAFGAGDGRELWRIKKNVAAPMVVAGGLLYIASGDSIEAIRTADHTTAWLRPGYKTAVPLVAHMGLLFVVTDSDVAALRLDSGEPAWQYSAGGVKLAPAPDGDRLYVGANDGRLVALNVKDGSAAWDTFVEGGITALAAFKQRIYVGGGDKRLHCFDSAKPRSKWGDGFPLGGLAVGRIAVDEDRLYVASLDNVVRALDRQSGNQRWDEPLRQRSIGGTFVAGHIVFVPVAATSDLVMLYDRDGRASGALNLPGEMLASLMPAFEEAPEGPIVYVVTGSRSNEWMLTKFARAGDAVLIPFAELKTLPGLPYLTDPQLMPLGVVLGMLIAGDPPLRPISDFGWPIMRTDPPLVPLTVLPGVQLRPLSPVLPARRGGSGPGG